MTTIIVASLLAAVAAPFQSCELTAPAAVWDMTARDITGDGKAELIAVCCDVKSDPLVKFVLVFPPNDSGGYSSKTAQRLDLDPSVSSLFFAEVDGAPPVELIAANAEGATVFSYSDGVFTPLLEPRFASLLPSGSKEPIFLEKVAQDLDGDGIDEWLIPVPSAYEVRNMSGLRGRIACDVLSEISDRHTIYIYHRLPSWQSFSLEGEPNQCLAFLSDEYADFAHGPHWEERERFKIPLNLDEKWEADCQMKDINADGLPDLIITQTKGTVKLVAMTQVYLASTPFTYPDAPVSKFEVKGAITSPWLIDMNNDGKQDILFVIVPLGAKNILNLFIRGKVSVHLEGYLFSEGTFPEKPTFSESFTLEAPEGRERVAYTLGDFNGDERVDIAFASKADKLAVHTGSPERFISGKPWVTLDLPAFGVARRYDLNGNKNQDLLIYHPSGENKKRIEVVIF